MLNDSKISILLAIAILKSALTLNAASNSTGIGVVFAPLVRKGDTPISQAYTQNITKVMLEVIFDGGYRSVTTYGVGGPDRPYDNQSIAKSTGPVHTAMAAAELNSNKNQLAMSVYQGLYHHPTESQVASEIEVGLELATKANNLFPGTVQAIVYPSEVEWHDLINVGLINTKIKVVSARTQALNMDYGVRVKDCNAMLSSDKGKFKEVINCLDFVICLDVPGETSLKLGYKEFADTALRRFYQAEQFLGNLTVILETGWPGDSKLKASNPVQDLIEFWKNISHWAGQNGKRIFLHEAFDNPWKDQFWSLAGHFGRWQYNENEPNLLSKNAYILKGDTAPTFLEWLLRSYIGIGMLVLLAVIVVIVIISVITLLYKRVRRIEKVAKKNFMLDEKDIAIFLKGYSTEEEKQEYGSYIWDESPYNDRFEVNKNQIKIDKSESGLLGKGQFGCVYRGELLLSNNVELDVAVKMIKPGCSTMEVKCLLSEIKILAYLGSHAHICSILAAYTKEISKGIVYFALEMCAQGNLKQFLLENKAKFDEYSRIPTENSDTTVYESNNGLVKEYQLVRWAFEIASAMEFVSSQSVIHSDLAARNVLLTAGYVAKVTDFGLSRRFLEEQPTYAKAGAEPLPWKWLAPESLELKQFSTKSDTWSYGVTLWEIFSLGSTPQYGFAQSWNSLLPELKKGDRLEKPEHSSTDLYGIMKSCWHLQPQERPTFTEIKLKLIELIDTDYQRLAE